MNRYKADLSVQMWSTFLLCGCKITVPRTLSGLKSEQERLSANTEQLNILFTAIDSSVDDDYADVLRSRLVMASRNGRLPLTSWNRCGEDQESGHRREGGYQTVDCRPRHSGWWAGCSAEPDWRPERQRCMWKDISFLWRIRRGKDCGQWVLRWENFDKVSFFW